MLAPGAAQLEAVSPEVVRVSRYVSNKPTDLLLPGDRYRYGSSGH
jgi:hypothetical protein